MRLKSYKELDDEVRKVWKINPRTRVKPLKREEEKINNYSRCSNCTTLNCDVCEYIE
jgi:hypothetical protein